MLNASLFWVRAHCPPFCGPIHSGITLFISSLVLAFIFIIIFPEGWVLGEYVVIVCLLVNLLGMALMLFVRYYHDGEGLFSILYEATLFAGGQYGRWAMMRLFESNPELLAHILTPLSAPPPAWQALSLVDVARFLSHPMPELRHIALLWAPHVRLQPKRS